MELSRSGTATLIAGHLAITAKHVLEAALRFGVTHGPSREVEGFELKLYQVRLPESGPVYRIWRVLKRGRVKATLRNCILAWTKLLTLKKECYGKLHDYALCRPVQAKR